MQLSHLLKCVALAAGIVGTTVSTQAATYTFAAYLDGASESPPVATPASGYVSVILDDLAHTLSINAFFSGLLDNTLAAHIHCCTEFPETGNAGVATQTPSFVGFPLGVTSGTFANTYDLSLASSWNPSFLTAIGGSTLVAEEALVLGLLSGRAYFNIHTNLWPSGEIRGFLEATPLPGALPLFASGIAALGLLGWRRRRTAVLG